MGRRSIRGRAYAIEAMALKLGEVLGRERVLHMMLKLQPEQKNIKYGNPVVFQQASKQAKQASVGSFLRTNQRLNELFLCL